MADALEALVVRPGDTLIIRVDPNAAQGQLDELKAAVEKRLPGVRTLVLGVDQIAGYRPVQADD